MARVTAFRLGNWIYADLAIAVLSPGLEKWLSWIRFTRETDSLKSRLVAGRFDVLLRRQDCSVG
jgi:hypothetical protein